LAFFLWQKNMLQFKQMKILVFNVGSSSIKFKLFESNKDLKELKKGKIERIGEKIPNHRQALAKLLKDEKLDLSKVDVIGHRVVHGGNKFIKIKKIDPAKISLLKETADLAPLHNPPEIEVIEEIVKLNKEIDQYAVFDTAFFSALPEKAQIYPLPYQLYNQGVKRYGFHGTSHKQLMEQGSKKLKLDLKKSKIITLHLGAGCSITAIKNGQPIDTSMGFTPLEGLMMQTRGGDLDPGIILYLIEHQNYNLKKLTQLLNYKSGILGITGKYQDMRDILFLAGEKVEDEDYKPEGFDNCTKEDIKRAKLALEIFIYRVQKYIGGYTAILGGLDGLIFGGAIGAGSSVIRNRITTGIEEVLGKIKAVKIKTDEEKQIAKEIFQDLT